MRRCAYRDLLNAFFAALVITTALPHSARAQPKPSDLEGTTEAIGSGPVRLRQTPPATAQQPTATNAQGAPVTPAPRVDGTDATPYAAGEFERFVQRLAGAEVRRLGADLINSGYDARGGDLSPLAPADYVIAPGDEVEISIWGSVEADLQLVVDRAGNITIPRIGVLKVAGTRYGELQSLVSRRVAQQFRNFNLSVALGQLRGIRVFVTGRVIRPGAYTVTSLSTVVSALMRAGGPSAAGSFRSINLSRGNKLVGSFDLYDLILKGDRSADLTVQAGDVVHVASVGTQVGVIGSVNTPAVIEIKPGETIGDAMRFAGGFSAVADRSRLAIERLKDRNAGRVVQLELPRDEQLVLEQGDVLRAFSGVEVALPTQYQSKRVKVEGEVGRPAEYVLPEGSSLSDAIRAAGGFTPSAYLAGAEFTRLSVQRTQIENYDRALRDLESDLARQVSTQRVTSADEASTQAARSAAANRLIERLRAIKPTGRIVLQLQHASTSLPELALEDGDRIYVPPRPTTVGVFGSVFNAATYLYADGKTLNDYLRLAGGATKGADERSVFVVRVNGNVVSGRQSSGWFNRSDDFGSLAASPGDTIFVPEEVDKTTFLQAAKDWTQILFQFGVGAAGIKSALQ